MIATVNKLIVESVSGTLDRWQFQQFKNQLRLRSIPKKPASRTGGQIDQDAAWYRLLICWSAFPNQIKAALNGIGETARLTGWNIYTKYAARDERLNAFHNIIPPNDSTPVLTDLVVQPKLFGFNISWNPTNWSTDWLPVIYYRRAVHYPEAFQVPWTAYSEPGRTMADFDTNIGGFGLSTWVVIALVPTHTTLPLAGHSISSAYRTLSP